MLGLLCTLSLSLSLSLSSLYDRRHYPLFGNTSYEVSQCWDDLQGTLRGPRGPKNGQDHYTRTVKDGKTGGSRLGDKKRNVGLRPQIGS